MVTTLYKMRNGYWVSRSTGQRQSNSLLLRLSSWMKAMIDQGTDFVF